MIAFRIFVVLLVFFIVQQQQHNCRGLPGVAGRYLGIPPQGRSLESGDDQSVARKPREAEQLELLELRPREVFEDENKPCPRC